MNDDAVGLFYVLSMGIVFICTAIFSDTNVTPEEMQYAAKVCADHGGLKSLGTDKNDNFTAYCANEVSFEYEMDSSKK